MQNLRVELKKVELLEFQVEASQGQNLQFKQTGKSSSRKQQFRTESGKVARQFWRQARRGKGQVDQFTSKTGGEKRMTSHPSL